MATECSIKATIFLQMVPETNNAAKFKCNLSGKFCHGKSFNGRPTNGHERVSLSAKEEAKCFTVMLQ